MSNTWCMRNEAKNAYFKEIAQIGNFKNLPLSIANRHQRLLCAHLQGTFFCIVIWNVGHVRILLIPDCRI